MEKKRFKTKLELIEELGLSKSTFYRLLEEKNIPINRKLLSPKNVNDIRTALGFQSLP